jgi:hypothetical protein
MNYGAIVMILLYIVIVLAMHWNVDGVLLQRQRMKGVTLLTPRDQVPQSKTGKQVAQSKTGKQVAQSKTRKRVPQSETRNRVLKLETRHQVVSRQYEKRSEISEDYVKFFCIKNGVLWDTYQVETRRDVLKAFREYILPIPETEDLREIEHFIREKLDTTLGWFKVKSESFNNVVEELYTVIAKYTDVMNTVMDPFPYQWNPEDINAYRVWLQEWAKDRNINPIPNSYEEFCDIRGTAQIKASRGTPAPIIPKEITPERKRVSRTEKPYNTDTDIVELITTHESSSVKSDSSSGSGSDSDTFHEVLSGTAGLHDNVPAGVHDNVTSSNESEVTTSSGSEKGLQKAAETISKPKSEDDMSEEELNYLKFENELWEGEDFGKKKSRFWKEFPQKYLVLTHPRPFFPTSKQIDVAVGNAIESEKSNLLGLGLFGKLDADNILTLLQCIREYKRFIKYWQRDWWWFNKYNYRPETHDKDLEKVVGCKHYKDKSSYVQYTPEYLACVAKVSKAITWFQKEHPANL